MRTCLFWNVHFEGRISERASIFRYYLVFIWTLGTPRKTSHFLDLEKVSRLLAVMLDSLPSFVWPSKFLLLLFIKQLMKFNIFVFLTFGTWYGFENCCQKVHKVFIHPHGLPFHFSHWSAHRTFINFSLLGTDFLIFYYYYYFLQTVNDLIFIFSPCV